MEVGQSSRCGVSANGAELALMVHISKLSCGVRVMCYLISYRKSIF
jgi:hypothetical protein